MSVLTLPDRARRVAGWWPYPAALLLRPAARPLDHRAHRGAPAGHRAGRARRHPRRRVGDVHLRHDLQRAADRRRRGRRRSASALALWSGRRLAARGDVGGRGPGAGAAGWRPAAASWSRGSRTTCVPRWPGCGRWPRRWRTASSTTRRRSPTTTAGSGSRPTGWPGWSTTCSSCPGSTPARCGCRSARCRWATSSPTRSRRRRRSRGRGAACGCVRRPSGWPTVRGERAGTGPRSWPTCCATRSATRRRTAR